MFVLVASLEMLMNPIAAITIIGTATVGLAFILAMPSFLKVPTTLADAREPPSRSRSLGVWCHDRWRHPKWASG